MQAPNNKQTTYIGIDVHKSFFQIAIIPAELMADKGKAWETKEQVRIKPCREDYNRLLALLSAAGNCEIAIDHTGGHYSATLVYFLTQAGYSVHYLHPAGLRNFKKGKRQLNKTDRIDAAYMARALYYHQTHGDDYHFSLMQPRIGSEAELLKTLISQRQIIIKLINQTENRLHAMLMSSFPEAEESCFNQLMAVLPLYPSTEAIIEAGLINLFKIPKIHKRKLTQILELAKQSIGISLPSYAEAIRELALQYNELQIKSEKLTIRIASILKDHPYTAILTSIPCLSTIAAATLISNIRDINYYDSPRKLRKELGCAPKITQSGSSGGRSRLAAGNKAARRALFQVIFAQLAPTAPDSNTRDYYRRRKAAGLSGTQAIVACMGKLCDVIYHTLKNGEFYEYRGNADATNISL